MKILVFTGGLGNQIFGYAFYLYLKENYPNERVYGIYSHKKMSEHYGLEIDKYFDVDLPPSPLLAKIITGLLFVGKKMRLTTKLVDMNTRTFDPKTIVNTPCKTKLSFIPEGNEWIHFKKLQLSNNNNHILQKIELTNSVFIHVRRGDYYSPTYIKKLGGTCPIDYYDKAIDYIKKHVGNIHCFVFSDDICWVKENLKIPDPVYIDWNTGEKSFWDLYLMSHCKYAIIANSTFSYWGAVLGKSKSIVCYPKKWVNPPFVAPDIFPKEWHAF